MAGKGDKRRPGKPGAYEEGYDAIDWSRGRPAPVEPKADSAAVLLNDHRTPVEWVIPDLKDILGPSAYSKLFNDQLDS